MPEVGTFPLPPTQCGKKKNPETNMFVKYFKENYTETYCKFPYRCFLVHLSLGVWEDPVADIATIDPSIFFTDQKKMVKLCVWSVLFWKYISPPAGIKLLSVFPLYSLQTVTG